jgi:glycosyltransferase involved in cell wall biosynthesis
MNDKLRVGIFTDDYKPLIGGIGRHIQELINENNYLKLVEFIVFSPGTYPNLYSSKFKNIGYSLKLNSQIKEIIKKNKIDIAHFHGGPGGVFLFRKLPIKVVYTCHHTYWQQIHYLNRQWWKFPFMLAEIFSYRLADKVIAVSEDTQSILINMYGINTEKSRVIYSGIRISQKISTKKSWRPTNNIIYIGRIDSRKGINFLISSMKELNKMNKDIHLDVVGDGKIRTELKKYAEKNNLNILFHGRLIDKDIDNLCKNAAIQVIPSIFEGFGLVALEAMSKGLLVIATDTDGLRGIINNGVNGYLVKYGENKKLAQLIIKGLTNPKTSTRLVKNAEADTKQLKYSWSTTLKSTVKTYEEIKTI